MSQNMSITVLTILIIAAGLYFMYGNPFSSQQVNMVAYQELCDKYRTAEDGKYGQDEMQMLINEINYLFPDEAVAAQDSATRELKNCAQALSSKVNQN